MRTSMRCESKGNPDGTRLGAGMSRRTKTTNVSAKGRGNRCLNWALTRASVLGPAAARLQDPTVRGRQRPLYAPLDVQQNVQQLGHNRAAMDELRPVGTVHRTRSLWGAETTS